MQTPTDIRVYRLILTVIVLLVLVVTPYKCHAKSILLVHTEHSSLSEARQIRQLAEFYGLSLDSIKVSSPASVRAAAFRLGSSDTLGALVSYDVLPMLSRNQAVSALRRLGRNNIPVLIFGVKPGKHEAQLRLWSGNALRTCSSTATEFRPSSLKIEGTSALVGALAGSQLPAVAIPVCTMQFDSQNAEPVLVAEGNGPDKAVLLRADANSNQMLFAPEMEPFDTSWVGKPEAILQAFSSMAPFLLFMKSAGGDYAWHLDGHYANLTIDDPWLIEPYGHLYYGALLEQMELHNFHTTIGFIPWNYDRSQADMVALFRAHPERLSISIHGNNHTHREFGDYDGDSFQKQVGNLRQAIARMERFQELTGIPYDRFMIFPHFVAPKPTFAALRMFDFLGTANSSDVPDGSPLPSDPFFSLRPYTSNYSDFLSLFRYSAEKQVPRTEISVHNFLGNPLLFYGHEKLFDKSIEEFNKVADFVNRLPGGTQWKSLGDIARHLYFIRLRDDGDFDVRMVSNEMELRNPTQRDAVFHVELERDTSTTMPSVSIGDSPAAVEQSRGKVTFRLLVPAADVRRVSLRHHNQGLSAADLGTSSFSASTLRYISDFRDLYLSRFSLGRLATSAYYQYGWDSIELRAEKAWKTVIVCTAMLFAALWWLRQRPRFKERERRIGPANVPARRNTHP